MTNTTNLYGLAILDTFGKWNLPLGAIRTKARARAQARFTHLKGIHPLHGEVVAIYVIPWGSRSEMREAVASKVSEAAKRCELLKA